MLYSDLELAWLNRRAARIAKDRGWPLPIAQSEAAAELTRGRASGHSADIVVMDLQRAVRHHAADDERNRRE